MINGGLSALFKVQKEEELDKDVQCLVCSIQLLPNHTDKSNTG